MNKFIPVKITDKKWAEKLLDGEVFMRSLFEFGSWNKNKDGKLDNSFRGDIQEGTAAVFTDINDLEFAKGLDPRFKEIVKSVSLIDESDIQYFKVFCLYCLDYIPETDFFEKPDPRMAEFGDTAVIIRDYNEFIERFGKTLFAKYPYVTSMIDRVSFFYPNEDKKTNPLFDKAASYSYQKELRMAFCEIEHNPFARGTGAEHAMSIVMNREPVTLQIGDIRDIAVAMPINDFLELRFPADIKLHFPMRGDGEEPSNFDGIVRWTREQMKNYRSIMVKPTFLIY